MCLNVFYLLFCLSPEKLDTKHFFPPKKAHIGLSICVCLPLYNIQHYWGPNVLLSLYYTWKVEACEVGWLASTWKTDDQTLKTHSKVESCNLSTPYIALTFLFKSLHGVTNIVRPSFATVGIDVIQQTRFLPTQLLQQKKNTVKTAGAKNSRSPENKIKMSCFW